MLKRRKRFKAGWIERKKRSKSADVWVFRWNAEDGTCPSRVIGSVEEYKTESAAKKAVGGLRLQINDGRAKQPVDLNSLIDRYLIEEIGNVRSSTRHGYVNLLTTHIQPKWGQTPLEDIKPYAVELWLKGLQLSPKTKVHIRNLMGLLLDCAMRWEVIEYQSNPMRLVRVKDASKRQKEPTVISMDDFQILLGEATTGMMKLAILMAGTLGLRCSELFALKWSDIEWGELSVKIQRAIVDGNVSETKTKHSKATLPLDPLVADELLRFREKSSFSLEQDWIFASTRKRGKLPVHPWNYQRLHLTTLGIKVGLGRIGWHTFRHSFRSWLDEMGTPVGVQQKLMRHASITTTMNTYGDALMETKREVIGRLAVKAVGGSK